MSRYIGISGIRDIQDVFVLRDISLMNVFDNKKIFLGFSTHLISQPSFFQQATEMLEPLSPFTGVLHHNVDSLDFFKKQLQFFANLPKWFSHIQLNDVCGNYEHILNLAGTRFKIIFALNEKNFEVFSDLKVVKFLQKNNCEVLVDLSGGLGKPVKVETYLPMIQELIHLGFSHLGVAGGLGPNSLGNYFALQHSISIQLSLDAESKLKLGDHLDAGKIIRYIQQIDNEP